MKCMDCKFSSAQVLGHLSTAAQSAASASGARVARTPSRPKTINCAPCLDERIGFPLDSVPDYDKLAPLFFEQFHGLAVQALRPSPTMTRRVRYKNAAMQRAFEGCLAAAFAKDKALFSPDGSQRRGSSQACAFWDGANGMARSPFVQPGSLTSACFAAGKAFRRANQHAEKTP